MAYVRSKSQNPHPAQFENESLVRVTLGPNQPPTVARILESRLIVGREWQYLLRDSDEQELGWFMEDQLTGEGLPSRNSGKSFGEMPVRDVKRKSPQAPTGKSTRTGSQNVSQAKIPSPPRPRPHAFTTANWTVDCELLDFMSEQYPGSYKTIDDILVLRGSSVNAECLTCKGFALKLARELESEAPLAVIFAINSALRHGTSKLHSSGIEVSLSIRSKLTGAGIHARMFGTIITVEATMKVDQSAADLEAMTQFLIFVAAALRPVKSIGLWTSDVEVLEPGTQICVKPLRQVVEQSCWHVLFPTKVIASDLEVRTRDHNTIGLEADLSLLMDLCGIDVPVFEAGGFTFQGVYTILVPISRDEKGNMQWHLLYVDPSKQDVLDFREELLLSQLPSVRFLTTNIRDFQEGRHFLGWSRSTVVTLGTEEQSYSTLRASTAPIKEREVVDSSTTVNLNFVLHGFGGAISQTRKLGKTEINPFQTRDRSLREWLVSCKREQVLLHRPSGLQSWLVPKPAVLLYSALAYMQTLEDEDPGLKRPWRQYFVSSGTEQRAYDALIGLTRKRPSFESSFLDYRDLRDAETRAREGSLPWPEIVMTLLHMMSTISRRSRVGRLNRKILGFELYDIVTQPQWFDLKQSHISNTKFGTLGGWTRLLSDVPIVLFFEGIDDPIISHKYVGIGSGYRSHKSGTCANLPRLTPDQNLMATTISSLRNLARRRGGINEEGQVTETAYWHSPRDHPMFEKCSHQACASGKCQTRQYIWPAPGTSPLQEDLDTYPEGGVIFAAGTGLSDGLFG